MHTLKLPFWVLFFLTFFVIHADAQSEVLFESESAFLTPDLTKAKAVPAPSPYRFHKKLQQLYSGYAIEVAASNFPLERDNSVFRQFGNVRYDKLKEGGYSYLVLANFDNNVSALHFLRTIVQPKNKEARLFLYKDGNRKIIRE